jgi:hypothetical protein
LLEGWPYEDWNEGEKRDGRDGFELHTILRRNYEPNILDPNHPSHFPRMVDGACVVYHTNAAPDVLNECDYRNVKVSYVMTKPDGSRKEVVIREAAYIGQLTCSETLVPDGSVCQQVHIVADVQKKSCKWHVDRRL